MGRWVKFSPTENTNRQSMNQSHSPWIYEMDGGTRKRKLIDVEKAAKEGRLSYWEPRV